MVNNTLLCDQTQVFLCTSFLIADLGCNLPTMVFLFLSQNLLMLHRQNNHLLRCILFSNAAADHNLGNSVNAVHEFIDS